MKPRYLTKSRYTKGQECPTKLYYQDRSEYENKNSDNAFLKALADGGFQVGALAKIYYPDGIEVMERDHEKAIKQTEELLKQKNVTIFEAAIKFNDFFIRVDILEKIGSTINLIEVKAKSFDLEESSFFDKRLLKKKVYKLNQKLEKYVYDVAFQTLVCKRALPEFKIHPFLMMADKTTTATVDGLNQRFLIHEENGRPIVTVKPGTDLKSVGEKILVTVDLGEVVDIVHQGKDKGEKNRTELGLPSFEQEALNLAEMYRKDERAAAVLTKDCKSCEFRTEAKSPQKNGFDECWAKHLQGKSGASTPFVFDIWNYRSSHDLLASGIFLMKDVQEGHIPTKDPEKPGMHYTERQRLQVRMTKNDIKEPFVMREELKRELTSWAFPLHFIDFETAMSAIPFSKGRRPYEQLAFQFSHHMLHADGTIEHAGEYLDDRQGEFPNFRFVRALKAQLERGRGTILRFANHENTVLCQIYSQLKASKEEDRDALMAWIKTITKSPEKSEEKWEGARNMIDMCELTKQFYYHPLTDGSNSIKKVLPAVLAESKFLKSKYSKHIYGSFNGIKSTNFRDWAWLKLDADGNVIDPYQLLPSVFENIDFDDHETIISNGKTVAEGGAAMTAFAKMQFTEMTPKERSGLRQSLLMYCELDTFAMVMLYEHWLEVTGLLKNKLAA